jgi:hypothetical protein
MEESIRLMYKGCEIGSRRVDIICEMTNGDVAILELKAVREGGLSDLHKEQLQYYMEHCDIQTGVLINFPHDAGWPCESDYKRTSVLPESPNSPDIYLAPTSNNTNNIKGRRAGIEITKIVPIDHETALRATAGPVDDRVLQAFASIEISVSSTTTTNTRTPTTPTPTARPERKVGKTSGSKFTKDCQHCVKTASGFCRLHLDQKE